MRVKRLGLCSVVNCRVKVRLQVRMAGVEGVSVYLSLGQIRQGFSLILAGGSCVCFEGLLWDFESVRVEGW